MGSVGDIQGSGSVKDWLDNGGDSILTRKFKFDKTKPIEDLTDADEKRILSQLNTAKTNSDYDNLIEQVNKLFDKNLLKSDFNKVKKLFQRVEKARQDKYKED